jgi:hypothetical protein
MDKGSYMRASELGVPANIAYDYCTSGQQVVSAMQPAEKSSLQAQCLPLPFGINFVSAEDPEQSRVL